MSRCKETLNSFLLEREVQRRWQKVVQFHATGTNSEGPGSASCGNQFRGWRSGARPQPGAEHRRRREAHHEVRDPDGQLGSAASSAGRGTNRRTTDEDSRAVSATVSATAAATAVAASPKGSAPWFGGERNQSREPHEPRDQCGALCCLQQASKGWHRYSQGNRALEGHEYLWHGRLDLIFSEPSFIDHLLQITTVIAN